MLVWRKGNIEKTVSVTAVCTIIMVHKGMSSSHRQVSFNIAWFSSVCRVPLCLWSAWCYVYIKIFLLACFSLTFGERSLVGLALDLVD